MLLKQTQISSHTTLYSGSVSINIRKAILLTICRSSHTHHTEPCGFWTEPGWHIVAYSVIQFARPLPFKVTESTSCIKVFFEKQDTPILQTIAKYYIIMHTVIRYSTKPIYSISPVLLNALLPLWNIIKTTLNYLCVLAHAALTGCADLVCLNTN